MLNDPENMERRRSRESLNADVVKYESGPDGGEEVSMRVEWSGVSTAWGQPPLGACRQLLSCVLDIDFPQLKYELSLL